MRVVLLPGWNEGADGMRLFAEGRHGRQGLAAAGFDCRLFDGGKGPLRDRIEQLAQFLAGLQSQDSDESGVTLFGYSVGGLIARALLRTYPRSAIAAIFQLAAPHAGIVTNDLRGLLRRIHFDRDVLEDLDIESSFMHWLNQTGGHWDSDPTTLEKRWKLDKKPWVISANVPIFNLIGRVPRYRNNSDGVVRVESASLNGLIRHHVIAAENANHLNLGATWNPLTLLLRGWRRDDALWPRAVAEATRLFSRPVPSTFAHHG
jgi:pimeloyl-ACP methyl ester carboxylesterase